VSSSVVGSVEAQMLLTIWTWMTRTLALLNVAQIAAWWMWQDVLFPGHGYRPIPFWLHTLEPLTDLGFVYLPALLVIEIGIFCIIRGGIGRFLLSGSLLAAAGLLSEWRVATALSQLR
jgi:hypothetical protein